MTTRQDKFKALREVHAGQILACLRRNPGLWYSRREIGALTGILDAGLKHGLALLLTQHQVEARRGSTSFFSGRSEYRAIDIDKEGK